MKSRVIRITTMEQWAKLVEKAGGALIYAVLLKVRHECCGPIYAPAPPPFPTLGSLACHACMPLSAISQHTLFEQPPEEGMLRATIQPLARQPAWSHVTFAEVDLKQLPVGRCTFMKTGSAM